MAVSSMCKFIPYVLESLMLPKDDEEKYHVQNS